MPSFNAQITITQRYLGLKTNNKQKTQKKKQRIISKLLIHRNGFNK